MNALGSLANDTDESTTVVTVTTPTANALLGVGVTWGAAGPRTCDSISGLNATWAVWGAETTIAGNNRVKWWRGMAASPSGTTVTIGFSGTVDKKAVTAFEFTGVNTTGTAGSGAVRNPTYAGPTTSNAPSVTLPAFGSADNGTFGGPATNATPTFTAGAGFTEIHDLQTPAGGGAGSIASEWRADNDTSVDGTLSASATWVMFGSEIVAAAAAAGWPHGYHDFERGDAQAVA